MTRYDEFASVYDRHFRRPVDLWENHYLAGLLRPCVNGKRVLDLGCGTGWVMDHCNPAQYTGIDASAPMLLELCGKHPTASGWKIQVGDDGWDEILLDHAWDCITSTWSLEYLGDTERLLRVLPRLLAPAGIIALHGSLPRGHRREHFSVKEEPWLPISPAGVAEASRRAMLGRPRVTGTSAWPDQMPCPGWREWSWAASAVPAGAHYACLWTWRPDGR